MWHGRLVVRHQQVAANGVRLHVALEGEESKPLVLCLHGFPECWYSWRGQLDALSDRFLVAAPDLRGYGRSDKPAHVADYRLDQLSNDAADLIHNLGYERAFIVAHDWGGIVAWHLASAHPEVVQKLAILNCPHPFLFMNRLARLDIEQLRRSTYMFFFQVPWLPERMYPPARLARVIRRTTIQRGVLTKADVAVFEKELSYPGTVHAALNYYRAIARDLMWPSRRKMLTEVWKRGIQAPTLIIWGERDPFLGIRLLEGHEALARTSLVVQRIPDVGHWVQQEAATEVNKALLSFFAPDSASPSGRALA